MSLLFLIPYWRANKRQICYQVVHKPVEWVIGLLIWLFERPWANGILCTANCTLVKELLNTLAVFCLEKSTPIRTIQERLASWIEQKVDSVVLYLENIYIYNM
jgi:hypothetical protein